VRRQSSSATGELAGRGDDVTREQLEGGSLLDVGDAADAGVDATLVVAATPSSQPKVRA